ncbi:hypothetical protein [Microcystis phage Mwe-JY25]
MADTCATCRFWKREVFPDGLCLARSPVAPAKLDHFGRPRAVWPETHMDNWCREHEPRAAAERDAQIQAMRSALTAAGFALLSYQHGNASPDLAESVAEIVENALRQGTNP